MKMQTERTVPLVCTIIVVEYAKNEALATFDTEAPAFGVIINEVPCYHNVMQVKVAHAVGIAIDPMSGHFCLRTDIFLPITMRKIVSILE